MFRDFDTILTIFTHVFLYNLIANKRKLIKKDRYFDDSAWLHFKLSADGFLY